MKLLRTLAIGIAAVSATSAAQDLPQVEPIDWQPCGIEERPELDCAIYAVPLSRFSNSPQLSGVPNIPTIGLALVRQPAADPDQRKGSLLVNPGGPGGSGIDWVAYAGPDLLTEEIRASYDLIGFDPRGIARSTPLSCLQNEGELLFVGQQPAFPMDLPEELGRVALDHYVSGACLIHASPIIHHMTTANVANDMELLRQALGEEKLNFYGVSWGTMLGMTYANLYPDRVGAFVLDGVLDPVAWSTGRGIESLFLPVSARLGSDASSMATLNEFFRLCDEAGPERCALAGDSGLRYARILERLKRSPIELMLDDETTTLFRYQDVIAITARNLFSIGAWQELAAFLAALEANAFGDSVAVLQPNQSGGYSEAPPPPSDQSITAFPAVVCADSDNPIVPFMWQLAGKYSEQSTGYFGRLWTWNTSKCSSWPGSKRERYAGPYNKPTANTILLVNTLFDPATGYQGAASAANILANSRLITIDGWGHSSHTLSNCADQHVTNYFLRNELPDEGTICPQDRLPFPALEEDAAVAQFEVRGLSDGPVAEQSTAQPEKNDWQEAKNRRERIMREVLRALPR